MTTAISTRPAPSAVRRLRPAATLLLMLALSAASAIRSEAAVFRVAGDVGNDANDGSEWTDMGGGVGPLQTIEAAIALATGGAGDEIWVKRGIYTPVGVSSSAFDLDGVALLLKEELDLIGGFDGTETTLGERVVDPFATIIDGSMSDFGLPASHVIGIDTVSGVLIDGFTITGGVAFGSYDEGGGIAIVDSGEIRIMNCVIHSNTAADDGGGMIIDETFETIIGNSIIAGNTSGDDGGGIGAEFCFAVEIFNSVISGNRCGSQGGGLDIDEIPFPLVYNSIISGNRAGDEGGGILNGDSNGVFVNLTIDSNSAANLGGGIALFEDYYYTDPVFANLMLTRNTRHSIGETGFYQIPYTLDNSLFDGNPHGDIFHQDTASTVNGAAAINALTEIMPSENTEGDPLYLGGPSGAWTAVSGSGSTRTLTDTSASFTPDTLAGNLIRADGAALTQFLIIGNTADSVTIVGEASLLTGIAVSDAWAILDYHTDCGAGADAGTSYVTLVPGTATDLDGLTRPMGGDFDIGAYESSVVCPTPTPAPTPTSSPVPTSTPSPAVTATPTPAATVTPTARPCCPGDADNSGSFVDASDFIAVQANFGADNGVGGLGDANCSGSFVDATDFIAVQANFGADCG